MRTRRPRAALALALAIAACTSDSSIGPARARAPRLAVGAAALPAVRIAELHYDNAGADAGEAIELSGPAGTDVTGWQLVLYNGNGGATYGTQTLSGTIPATCGARGVLVVSYPSNGIQNGGTSATGTTDPDGVALVDAQGAVVEFLSYEGVLAATNGPAAGTTSTDIGVRELGNEPPGQSLARDGAGTWGGPAAATFGACNDDQTAPPAPVATVTVSPAAASIAVGGTLQLTATALDAQGNAIPGVPFTWTSSAPTVATASAAGLASGVGTGDATITATAPNGASGSAAVHVDPATTPTLPPVRLSEIHYDNVGADAGESIEVEGPAGTSLAGWSVVLYNGNGGVAYSTQALSGTIADQCSGRGVALLAYPQDGIQNGSPDGVALVDAAGHVVEFLSYEGTFTATDGPAAGLASTDIGVQESSSPIGQSLQRDAAGAWSGPAASSFGACNGGGSTPGGNVISFTGRTPSDPPLPVGFQDQLFATVRTPGNVVVPTTITWTSETPAVASIDQDGVITALAAGTATLRATAADGVTTGTYSLPTIVATPGGTAQYAGNAEFGEPADADPSDDFIVRRAEYTLSYSRVRNTPNWVSYDIDATHFGLQDRCDCFTFDPALPASYAHYTTADYTGAGAFHGYGIDRGHLARSFDRTSGSLDNAHTFYFSNIIPQAADLNQGPWAAMESDLGDLARLQNREVYVIAGVAGSKGTLKDLGVITIPAQVWKVAVILPRDRGLASVHTAADLQVVAALMPNDPGVRNVDWHTYETTVDAVEAASGYDLLALLPDLIENAVEGGSHAPVAAANGPYTAFPGETITMSAAGSADPDGDALAVAWQFGDGASASGLTTTHAYASAGTFTVRAIVTDAHALADTALTTATVLTPAEGAAWAVALVDSMRTAGTLGPPSAIALRETLDAARRQLEAGRPGAALAQLRAANTQLFVLVRTGALTDAQAKPLRTLVLRVIVAAE